MIDMSPGLLITAIGMGLVFLAIIFLWGLMSLIVRLDTRTASKNETVEMEDKGVSPEPSLPPQKQKAAAAALAVALALAAARKSSSVASAPVTGSSWLSIQRAQVLQDKSRMFTRHPSRRS